MKKVIPKKKNAFFTGFHKVDKVDLHTFQPCSMGIAGKDIYRGNVVMLDENGMVVPFKGSEGRSNV